MVRLASLLSSVACAGTATVREAAVTKPIATTESEGEAPAVAGGLQVAIGTHEGCAVRGGELWCWGSLVEGEEPERVDAVPIRGSSVELVVTDGTACVIDDGRLTCFGALTSADRYEAMEAREAEGASPEEIDAMERGPFPVTLASEVTGVAIAIEGLCWVSRGRVRCHVEDEDIEGAYNALPPIDDAVRIAMTDEHACVVKRGGSLLCWGLDPAAFGGRARGQSITHDLDATDVVAGLGYVCALTRSGAVTCLGETLMPVELYDENETPRLTWPGVAAVELAGGDMHVCARTASGSVHCAGTNEKGQVGDGTTEERFRPVRSELLGEASSLAVGGDGTCAVRGETLRCVGDGRGGSFDAARSVARSTAPAPATKASSGWFRRASPSTPSRSRPSRNADQSGLQPSPPQTSMMRPSRVDASLGAPEVNQVGPATVASTEAPLRRRGRSPQAFLRMAAMSCFLLIPLRPLMPSCLARL